MRSSRWAMGILKPHLSNEGVVIFNLEEKSFYPSLELFNLAPRRFPQVFGDLFSINLHLNTQRDKKIWEPSLPRPGENLRKLTLLIPFCLGERVL